MSDVSVSQSSVKAEHAYLSISTGTGEKTFTFAFNPNEYTISKAASWRRSPVPGAPLAGLPEFVGAEPRVLTVEILLDASDTESGSIADDLDTLFSCCNPTPESVSSNAPTPPRVKFGWGSSVLFTAFVREVEAQVTFFRQNGVPLRARCTVTLEEIPEATPRQNPTSGSLATHQTHLVVEGDTLASIAFQLYGRADLWRALAIANDVDDPLRLAPGTTLLVPPREEAEALV
jgi:nucleoid-associated protein YgaU